MALTTDQKDRISEIVKVILERRIENFPQLGAQVRNAPFHDAFLDCFKKELAPLSIETPYLIAIASWLHGLNTSLGTGFEAISHILSGGYKKSFTNGFVLNVKNGQASNIENIIRELKAGTHTPDLNREDELILNFSPTDTEIPSLPFTVDTYIEKDTEIIAIEIKSVRPNSGEGRGEKQKILYGKAALKKLHPNKNIKFFIAFPFDPTGTSATDTDKTRFFNYLIEFKKFFDPREVLLGPELWDLLSGSKGTMDEILGVIRETVSKIRPI